MLESGVGVPIEIGESHPELHAIQPTGIVAWGSLRVRDRVSGCHHVDSVRPENRLAAEAVVMYDPEEATSPSVAQSRLEPS